MIEPAGKGGTLTAKVKQTVTLNKLNASTFVPSQDPGFSASGGEYTSLFEFNTRGLMTRREEQFAGNKLAETQWVYDGLGNVINTKEYVPGSSKYRSNFEVYDYQLKAKYKTLSEDTAVDDNTSPYDVISHYDPEDYRGNVVRTLSTSGYSVYMYETDNEKLDAMGRLMHSIENGTVWSAGAAQGKPNPTEPSGGPNVKIITSEKRDGQGRITEEQALRSWNFASTQKWSYNDKGYLASHTDPIGLVTEYTYGASELPTNVRVIDDTAGEIVDTAMIYDVLGFPSMQVTATPTSSQLISTFNTVYDTRGTLHDELLTDPLGQVLSHNQFQSEFVKVTGTTPEDFTKNLRVDKSIDANGTVTQSTYDVNGLLKNTKVADGLTYANKFLNTPISVGQDLDYSYYSNGLIKGIWDNVNEELLTKYYYEPGASLSATNGSYFGTRNWTVTNGVAGGFDAQGRPTHTLRDVEVSETDGLGRVHVTNNLLLGGKTSYTYADPRMDMPTQIQREQREQGSHTAAPTAKDLVIKKNYDNRGNVIYEKTGSTAAKTYGFDEIGALTKSAVLAEKGAEWRYIAGPTGLPNIIIETRKEEKATGAASDPYDDGADSVFMTFSTFDSHGRVATSKDPTVLGSDLGAAPSRTKRAYVDGFLVTYNTDRLKLSPLQKPMCWDVSSNP